METHRACEPDGGFKEKNKETKKKNKKETHLEKWESQRVNCGGGSRKPRQRTRPNWARRPTNGGNKIGNKNNHKKKESGNCNKIGRKECSQCVTTYRAIVVLCCAISRAAIWLAEPQRDWRRHSAACENSVS